LSDFDKLGLVIKYEFLKHIRRRRLYVILGIALLAEVAVLILIPILRHGYPDNVLIMASVLSVGPSLAAIGAVFFAGDAIAGEFEGKTGFLLFVNPIKREVLWAGKYIAGAIAMILLILFTYVIIAVSLLVIYGQLPAVKVLESFGLCLLYAAAVLSLTFFFSAISKGSMGATVMTLLFIWVLSGIIESVLGLTGHLYWFLISAGGDSINLPYGSLQMLASAFGGQNYQQMMGNYRPLEISQASYGMLIYLVVGFVVSIWISRRRQLA
jgi:ABC-2 type transport system permease protein